MAEIKGRRSYRARMEMERANTDLGFHDSFSKFVTTANVSDHWPLEGEFDMHLCLKCLSNVFGLSKYLLHKLKECPKLRELEKPPKEPENLAESEAEIGSTLMQDELDQQEIMPVEVEIGSVELNLETSTQEVALKNGHESSPRNNGAKRLKIDMNMGGPSPSQKSGVPSFSNSRQLRTTSKTSPTHLPVPKVNPFSCQPCGLTCASRTALVYHLASSEHWRTSSKDPIHEKLILAHSEELAPLAPYKCSICPFYFNKLEDLANHYVKESEAHRKKLGQYRQLLCTSCKFRCWTIEELQEHLNQAIHRRKSPQSPIILSGTDDFVCTKCNFTCKRHHALLFHIKWKHSGEIHCKDCQMTFDEKEELNRHNLEVEHDNYLFYCAICPFVGRTKLSFQAHLKQGHQESVGGVKRRLEMNVQDTNSKLSVQDSLKPNCQKSVIGVKQRLEMTVPDASSQISFQDLLKQARQKSVFGIKRRLVMNVQDASSKLSFQDLLKQDNQKSASAVKQRLAMNVQGAGSKLSVEDPLKQDHRKSVSGIKQRLGMNVQEASSKLSFQDPLKQDHQRGAASGVKGRLEMNVPDASSTSPNDSPENVVQQFMKTVDNAPRRAILQIQKIQSTEDAAAAASSSKEKGSPGPLTFVKFDDNCDSKNGEPFVIFVVNSERKCANNIKPDKVDDSKQASMAMRSSEHEALSDSNAPDKEILKHLRCFHCGLKFDNQKALKNHLKTMHPDKLFYCKPCVLAFCSMAKLELHMKGRLHKCNTKDAMDIEKGYLKPATEFSCKYCAFRTATKAGVLFHEVMHLRPARLTRKVVETRESEKPLQEGQLPDVIKTVKENEECCSSGQSNKDTDDGIDVNSTDCEDSLFVHVIDDDENEVVVETSKDAEQGQHETDGKLHKGSMIDDKHIGTPMLSGDTVVKEKEPVIENAEPSTRGKSARPPKLYICPICQEHFTATKLRFHLIAHTGEQLFTCSICSSSFSRKASLVSHEKDQHGVKNFSCQKCPFRTNRKIKLDEHEAIHDGEKRLKEFPCETCGAKFFNSSALQTHMLVHATNKGRTVPCTFKGCTKSFRYQSEMLQHKVVHSEDVSFLCELCGFKTKSQQLLRKHERSHDDIKKFRCSYCSYGATHSHHLNRHMRIHCQVKPYSCPYCEFTCNTQENLRKHILNSKKHQGLKVYQCRHCDFSTNASEEMKLHTIRDHSEIAKQYDEDNPAFSSLVTGNYKPESDLKVPKVQPAPYIPVKDRQKSNKKIPTSAEESGTKLNIGNSSNGSEWLQVHKATVIDEVDLAVESLIEATIWELETPDIPAKNAGIESGNDLTSSGETNLDQNVPDYQLFDDTDISFVKEELVSMDIQDVADISFVKEELVSMDIQDVANWEVADS